MQAQSAVLALLSKADSKSSQNRRSRRKEADYSFRAFTIFISALACLLALTSHAGVTVTQNVSPGATAWPGTPLISTMANPTNIATVSESFTGGSGNTNLSQTFLVATTNYTLQRIDLYVGGGSGTNLGTNITLNLFDLGSQTAPNPSPYSPGITGDNLLGSGAGLSIPYSTQANNSVLQLDFNGSDQAYLQIGHTYAFELTGVLNTTPIFWYRSATDTYSGGAAYRNQSWINGNSGRDFALAVYGVLNTNPPPVPAVQCQVDWNDVHQRIDGFGASSAWRGTWSASQADMFFSTNSGTGVSIDGRTNFAYSGIALSFLRNRIVPNSTGTATAMTTTETGIMQMARDRGARVWSAPWTPPSQYKIPQGFNGGNLATNLANYQAYANQLAAYVAAMKTSYGVNLYALSVQNEPDANVTTYEACKWTSQQIHDFLPYLANSLSNNGVSSTKIMIAESQNWKFDLATNSMQDAATSNLVGVLAAHSYGSSASALNNYGKALWETEDSILTGSDSSISNGVYWAAEIHAYMTVAEANAWHYWWLISGNSTGNQGLADNNGVPAKRMYTVGNFSRFVRPNYFRVGVNNHTPALVSAYRDTNSGAFAIVAINSGNSATNLTFVLTNFTAGSVTPWVTSTNLSLAGQPAVALANSTFAYTLPAVSVVTFVGTTNLPATPANLSPANGALNQPLAPLLQASAFSDPDPGATHAASQWLVQRAADSLAVFDSGSDAADKTSLILPASLLDYGTAYNWQVRYLDNRGAWSGYSAATAFTTLAPALSAAGQAGALVCSWPTNTSGFLLEYTTNLAAPNWLPVSPAPPNGQFLATNAMTNPAAFFRLRKL